MIKKVIFSMAALALLTFSCTRSEMENVNVPSKSVISLSPRTASSVSTYAAITDVGALQGDANGFVVYADTAGAAGWYSDGTASGVIDGSNNHVYAGGGWRFSNAVLWPAWTDPGFYMSFLAYYPDAAVSNVITSATPVVPSATSSLVLDITIPVDKGDQEDVIVARDTAFSDPVPGGGKLSLTFKHILSKVNFTVSNADTSGLITDPDHKAYVMAVGFCNLFTTNNFEVAGDGWGTNVPSGLDTFNYFNAFVPSTAGAYTAAEFIATEEDPFFTGTAADNEHLMLLPQSPTAWNPSSYAAPTASEAYIRMLYRLETADTVNYIGFQDAQDHPNIGVDTYSGPLYVLVGYSYLPTWDAGKGYSYNIPIPGNSGGILLDLNYYDEEGNRTNLVVENHNGLNRPLFLGAYSIQLVPDVDNWDDSPGSEDVD